VKKIASHVAKRTLARKARRTARRRKGLITPEQAWRLAASEEIDPTTYSRIERGEREATFEQKLALARVLGVEPANIFTG